MAEEIALIEPDTTPLAITEFPISVRFAVIDAATGRIKRSGICSTELFARQAVLAGERTVLNTMPDDADPASFYSPDGTALAVRPTMAAKLSKTAILANGTDAAVLSGLPDPCTVLVNGVEQSVTGGSINFKSNGPGTFTVVARHWPHVDWSATIMAT